MALTRIQKGMLAAGAVTNNNLDSTATFTATTFIATTQITTPKISVSGSSGLTIQTLRVNTGSWITYYNPTTKEMTYGPITGTTGTLSVFDQQLNTTDNVLFANVTSTNMITAASIAITTATGSQGINFNNTQIRNLDRLLFAGPGNQKGINWYGGNWWQITDSNNDLVTEGTGNLQFVNSGTRRLTIATDGSVQVPGTLQVTGKITGSQFLFSGYSTITNSLKVQGTVTSDSLVNAGTRYPDDYGSNGQVLKTNGAGTASWGTIPYTDLSTVTNQGLFSTSSVTFSSVTVTSGSQVDYSGGIRGGVGTGKDLYLFAGPNGYDGVIKFTASYLEPACSIIPRQYVNIDLGSPSKRWRAGYIKTLYVGTTTIYFEDDNNLNTATFTVSTSGHIAVNDTVLVNQSVAVGSAPTFSAATITNVVLTTATISGFAQISGGATISAATVTNAATIGASLGVSGLASLSGGATISATTITNAATIGASLGVTGHSSLSGGATISATTITNAATVGTTLGVTGLASLSGGATISAATVTNNLSAGASTLQNLSVTTGTTVNRVASVGGFGLNSAGTGSIFTGQGASPVMIVSNNQVTAVPAIYVRAHGQNRPGGSATTNPAPWLTFDSSRGSAAAPTAVQNNDLLGGIQAFGYDGANYGSDYLQVTPNTTFAFFAAENFTNSGTSTYQAGTGAQIFLQPAWTRPGIGASRQRMMLTSWTTSSTGPSQLNLNFGSGVDGSTATVTMVDGTSYQFAPARTNIQFVNSQINVLGVPNNDTAPDNATLTSTNFINIVSNRRSGATGRRNTIQANDSLGGIAWSGQSSNNATGFGSVVASLVGGALETFTGSVRGTFVGINTNNTGTIVSARRLYLSDQLNNMNADTNQFFDKSGSFSALSLTTSTAAFGTGVQITTYNRNYGEFAYTGTTITATATNTIYAFPLNTTNTSSGIVIQSGQQIKFNRIGGGFFEIIMSLQTDMTTNVIGRMEFWLRKNGTDVPSSATQVDLLKDQKAVIAMNWLVTPAVNDYYEIVYAVNDTNLNFPYFAAQSSPYVRPAIPPIIVTVIPVGA